MSRDHPLLPVLFSIIAPFIQPIMASTSAPSSVPQVDFGRMGNVGLGGAFTGLDWFSGSSPFAASSSASAFSTDGDTIFARSTDGSYVAIGSTDSAGTIDALCWSGSALSPSDSASNGTLYIGGNFSSISSIASSNIIAYSLSSNTFHAVSSGLVGPVHTLFCDDSNDEVWAGGSFAAPIGTGGNVALWSRSSSSWSTPAFGGLNGPVKSITPSSTGSSLYFAGQFTTSFASNSSTNTTSSNFTSVQSAPANTSTTGNSGYLTPVTLPSNSAASGNLTVIAGPATSQAQYSDAEVLLCPGQGTWLGQDNTAAQVDVEGSDFFTALGARISNSQVEGRGATQFCITSLPDYTQLNMTYTDPVTGKNETCWSHCPLSTNSSIGAQDFIFTTGPKNLTGLQMELKAWTGDGPGLSSVQLLSNGAYGSSVASTASNRCNSSETSFAQQNGTWTQGTLNEKTSAALSPYLTSTIPTSNPTYPSVTFYPYVSAAAFYDVYLIIPGCLGTGDCAGRSSVDIEVFPYAGGSGWTGTISEQVQNDTSTLVYSGWVDGTSSSFSPTVRLALAYNPAAPASGDNYVIVAEAVELVLLGVNRNGSVSGSAGTSVNGMTNATVQASTSMTKAAFGVFEYVRSFQSTANAASSTLSNITETALTQAGFALDTALNSSGSLSSGYVNAIAAVGDTAFVAGIFVANNFSNVLAVDTTSGLVSGLAAEGLNGAIETAAVVNSHAFFGGSFNATAAAGGVMLNYIARYDPIGKAWSALGGGLDGPVTDLLASPASSSQLIVLGNFSHVLLSNGTSTETGGYAVWDDSKSAWEPSGGVSGNVSAAAASRSSSALYFAGRVSGASGNAVSGVAMLSTNGDGSASISTLTGANFDSTGSAASTTSTRRRRSFGAHRRPYSRNWLSRFTDALIVRASPMLIARATAPTILTAPAPAPAVLAGTFWQNSSASGKPSITILGGNFSSGSGPSQVEGVAFYSNNTLSGPSPPVQGVVRALAVIGNDVYVGGTGVNVSGVGSGLLVYNFESSSWMTSGMASLNAQTGLPLSVNAIKQRTDTNTVVIAGNFGSAGSLSCTALCLWDSSSAQWTSPGAGISSGEVRAVDFAGDSYETLIVTGSFVLSNGNVAHAASYSFDNSTWTALGSLPGPALAVAVNNHNISNIYAAGYSASDSMPYLQQWNGQSWTAQNDSLEAGSMVQQLAFVPMVTEHTAVGSIEDDRMLMVSGILDLTATGNVSSALYDGARWYPYLVGTSHAGTVGSASALFWSDQTVSYTIRHFLARGLVVLVAMAIATGLILLFILIALLIAYVVRRTERRRAPSPEVFEKHTPGSEVSSTHQNVLNNVQAALEQSLIGGGASAAIAAATSQRRSEQSFYVGTEDAVGAEGYEDSDEGGRETTMRFNFDGPELQQGEMSMKAGQPVIILDDEVSTEWWYARDPATGREGVVPATYVW